MYKKCLIIPLIIHSGFNYAEDQVSQQQTRDYLTQKQQIDQLTQSVAPFIQSQQTKVDSSYPWLQKESICFGISSLEVDVPTIHPSIKTADFNRLFKELKY
jgi:hypothetical protein